MAPGSKGLLPGRGCVRSWKVTFSPGWSHQPGLKVSPLYLSAILKVFWIDDAYVQSASTTLEVVVSWLIIVTYYIEHGPLFQNSVEHAPKDICHLINLPCSWKENGHAVHSNSPCNSLVP